MRTQVSLADRYQREVRLSVSRRHDTDDTVDLHVENGPLEGPSLNLRRRVLLAALDAEPAEAPPEPAEAPLEPAEDQDQLDRAWALERAAEALERLSTDRAGDRLIGIADWIVRGQEADRG